MDTYTIKNYGKKSTFASFLPGISGVHGTPLWCYYVNRGQGVVSFGVKDKDHSIMEFYPAHQAYQNVKRTGFRTFLKAEGKVWEPFSDEEREQEMKISMNLLSLTEQDQEHGIRTEVTYYTLPDEKLGALVRKLEIRNMGEKTVRLQLLDGMPALIPYGIDLDSIKNMGQTIKAWMQVEDLEKKLPYFRVRASVEDSASVKEVKEGCFSIGCTEDGEKLLPVVDPELIFGYDVSMTKPVGFEEKDLFEMLKCHQEVENQFPCCFFGVERVLSAGDTIALYQVIGQAHQKEDVHSFAEKIGSTYFEGKRERAEALTRELVQDIFVKTASEEFDAYCQYTYMDNILRGGLPLRLAGDKVFYVYSRKHGDLERDYNYFSMYPEYYSQGNGNFRDVNQNRRCDVFFHPYVGTENIHTFYSLIQMDGYNPLKVEMITYSLEKEKGKQYAQESGIEELESFLTEGFTPGSLLKKLEEKKSEEEASQWFNGIIRDAKTSVSASFGEGYWSDHWTYNLDLVENYLSIFPDKEEELLYEKSFTWFLPEAYVNPRKKRYAKTEKGVRQYYAITEAESEDRKKSRFVCEDYGKGAEVTANLMEKLLLICAVKYATLDAYGCGVEMEGGKPGWYDALNGMPGLFGSSLAETCELGRVMEFTIEKLKKYHRNVSVFLELGELIRNLEKITEEEWECLNCQDEVLPFWNKTNYVKEAYREKVYAGISGEKTVLDEALLIKILEKWYAIIRIGIDKASKLTGDFCPTYLTWEMQTFTESEEGIVPVHFAPVRVPIFLEGPVRRMKLADSLKNKKRLYDKVKDSGLFDRELSMYKVNDSLEDASYELGRARAFTPGWLENESIWLHMEYKYLLELLKNGMYEEFFRDFHRAAVPFQNPEIYGRSILENSSFIASSKNPNKKYHGKGFVARLSGSTVEMIEMWQKIFFGKELFSCDKEELTLTFAPAIPSWMIREDSTVEACFMSNTMTVYHMDKKEDYFPGDYETEEITVLYSNGEKTVCKGNKIKGQNAHRIRKGEAERIDISLKKLM